MRVGAGWVILAARNGPPLVRLGLEGSIAREGRELAQAIFRDELIGLARESAELSWREMRSAIDGLDTLTSASGQTADGPRTRPHRVKL
jgi:hypothetical protein